MRQIPLILITLTLLPSTSWAQAEPRQSREDAASWNMPPLLYSSDPDYKYPRWVSASAALDANGSLNSEYFYPISLRTMREYLEAPEDHGCILVEEEYSSFYAPPDQSTLEKAVAASALITYAKVTGRDYGFHGSVPGQLVRVEPVETIRQRSKNLPEYFVFFPVGTFNVGAKTICKIDRRYAAVPEVGDHLLLLVAEYFHRDPAEPFIELGLPGTIITFSQDGKVSLPSALTDSDTQLAARRHSPTLAQDLLQTVRDYAKKARGGQ